MLRRVKSSPTMRARSQITGEHRAGGLAQRPALTRHHSFHPGTEASPASVSPRNRNHSHAEMPDALARWKARRTDPHTQKLLHRCDSFSQPGRNKSHSFHTGIDTLVDGFDGSIGEEKGTLSWKQWRATPRGKLKARSLSPSAHSRAFVRQTSRERASNSNLSQGSEDVWGQWVGEEVDLDVDLTLDELELEGEIQYTQAQQQHQQHQQHQQRRQHHQHPPLHPSGPSADYPAGDASVAASVGTGVGVGGVPAAGLASTGKRAGPNLTVLLPKEAQLMHEQQQQQQQRQHQHQQEPVVHTDSSESRSPLTPPKQISPHTPSSPHEPMTPNTLERVDRERQVSMWVRTIGRARADTLDAMGLLVAQGQLCLPESPQAIRMRVKELADAEAEEVERRREEEAQRRKDGELQQQIQRQKRWQLLRQRWSGRGSSSRSKTSGADGASSGSKLSKEQLPTSPPTHTHRASYDGEMSGGGGEELGSAQEGVLQTVHSSPQVLVRGASAADCGGGGTGGGGGGGGGGGTGGTSGAGDGERGSAQSRLQKRKSKARVSWSSFTLWGGGSKDLKQQREEEEAAEKEAAEGIAKRGSEEWDEGDKVRGGYQRGSAVERTVEEAGTGGGRSSGGGGRSSCGGQ
jgi:hypothetical protein